MTTLDKSILTHFGLRGALFIKVTNFADSYADTLQRIGPYCPPTIEYYETLNNIISKTQLGSFRSIDDERVGRNTPYVLFRTD